MSTTGQVAVRRALSSRRSCRAFQPGTKDRCTLRHRQLAPGVSTTAATATRGSSRTSTGRRRPGNIIGTGVRTAGSRTVSQADTG